MELVACLEDYQDDQIAFQVMAPFRIFLWGGDLAQSLEQILAQCWWISTMHIRERHAQADSPKMGIFKDLIPANNNYLKNTRFVIDRINDMPICL